MDDQVKCVEHVACTDMKRIYSFIRGRELKKDLKETRLEEAEWTGFIWLKTATITGFFFEHRTFSVKLYYIHKESITVKIQYSYNKNRIQ
jgi:hypothetical protein